MSQRAAPPAFPEALDDDDDDVTWALQTAAVQWKRGAFEDAVEWLYRAIESAVDGGRTIRARQIQKQVNALEAALRSNSGSGQFGSAVGRVDGESNAGTSDPYTEVAVDLDIEPEEDTGLHTRRSIEERMATEHPALSVRNEDLIEDAEIIEEVDDLDDAEVISLSKPRIPLPIRSDRYRLRREEPREAPAVSQLPEAEVDPEHVVSLDDEDPDAETEPPPSLEIGPDAYLPSEPVPASVTFVTDRPEIESGPPTEAPPSEGARATDAPDSEQPATGEPRASDVTLAPSSGVALDADPNHDEEEPTERSMEVAPISPSGEMRGSLLPFREPPSDETTRREAVPLPSEPSPSSREREIVPDSEPGTSPDLSVLMGPPDSGPPTEPTPESPEGSAVREPPAAPSSVEPSVPVGPPMVRGVLLSEVPGLEDLPEESQQALAQSAQIHALDPNEEVGGFGLALVLQGSVSVMPAVADYAAARANRGELVFSQGHLEQGVQLRVVAGAQAAEVATWDAAEFDRAIADCPWVGDDLRVVGDRFQALSGVTMGKMGEQLDEMLRDLVVERCEVRRLLPGEVLVELGKPIPGMIVLGAGHLEIVESPGHEERVIEALAPGDFLFASEILQASPAPATARAGQSGALILFADRKVAHELLVSVPPLLGIFAQ